jgi:hypothetical protein
VDTLSRQIGRIRAQFCAHAAARADVTVIHLAGRCARTIMLVVAQGILGRGYPEIALLNSWLFIEMTSLQPLSDGSRDYCRVTSYPEVIHMPE